MNERIRELADEARIKFSAHWAHQGVDTAVITRLDLKEFTELIVKECMKESWEEIVADEDIALEKDPLIREYLKGNNQGIVDAVVRFRNHFGVEE